MSLDLSAICPDADAAFECFFLGLGYKVYWDGKRSTGERWYEIYDDTGRVLQISMPPPLVTTLIADLSRFIESTPGGSPIDYWCVCEDAGKLRDLLRRATAAEAT